jgi:hypothetical protein
MVAVTTVQGGWWWLWSVVMVVVVGNNIGDVAVSMRWPDMAASKMVL